MIVFLNGEWIDDAHASISIHDRGFLLGDGVFETARLVHGKYFRLRPHLDRLRESARQLSLQVPDDETLTELLHQIAARNQLRDASARITITRGRGGRGLDTRGAGPQTLLVTIAPVASDWRERAGRGWHLIVARTRRPSPLAVPAQLKTIGRVYALLAHLEAEAAGADDALLVGAEDYVAEGPTWNFFWRKGNTLRTAAPGIGVLEGVTRAIVLDTARSAGYEVEEGNWQVSDVRTADEAFASMTSLGIVPIRSLDGHIFPSDDAAVLFQRKYWEFVHAEIDGDRGRT